MPQEFYIKGVEATGFRPKIFRQAEKVRPKAKINVLPSVHSSILAGQPFSGEIDLILNR